MTTDYETTWEAMNSLEQITAKVISAREILNSSRHYLECHENQRAETLIVAAQDLLDYYLKEFDEKFKVAWNETVVKSKTDGFFWDTDPKGNLVNWTENTSFSHDCMDNSSVGSYTSPWLDCMDGFSESQEKKTWRLPVEEVNNGDTGEIDYFVTLPDDLLEETGWDEGTELVWEDNGNGSYTLRKL